MAARGAAVVVLAGVEALVRLVGGLVAAAPEAGWEEAFRTVIGPVGGAALAGWAAGLWTGAKIARRA